MGKCWPLEMPPTPKAVLISIADQANDHGYCWPAISTICARTCYKRTAVIEAIQWLESEGYLIVHRRSGRHNAYTVDPSAKRTSPPNEPVRQTDHTSPPNGRDPSAKRTLTVKNRKEPEIYSSGDDPSRVEHRRGETSAGYACRLMRQAGCMQTNPSHPDLIAALDEGITPETLADYAATAKDHNFRYAIVAARNDHQRGATPITKGQTHAGNQQNRKLSLVERGQHELAELERQWAADDARELRVIEGTSAAVVGAHDCLPASVDD